MTITGTGSGTGTGDPQALGGKKQPSANLCSLSSDQLLLHTRYCGQKRKQDRVVPLMTDFPVITLPPAFKIWILKITDDAF